MKVLPVSSGSQDRPIGAHGSSHRWYGWLAAGAAMLAIGGAIPAIDGGELNEGWWTAFAVAVLTGTEMILAGVILAVNGRSPRSKQPAL